MKLLQNQILGANKRFDFIEIPDLLNTPITGKKTKKTKKTFAENMAERGYKEYEWEQKEYDKPWLEGLKPEIQNKIGRRAIKQNK